MQGVLAMQAGQGRWPNTLQEHATNKGRPGIALTYFFSLRRCQRVKSVDSPFRQDPPIVSDLSRSLTRSTSRAGPRRSRVISPSLLVGLRCHLLGEPAVSAIVAMPMGE